MDTSNNLWSINHLFDYYKPNYSAKKKLIPHKIIAHDFEIIMTSIGSEGYRIF